MPNIQNIFGGAGNDTIVATTPAGFLSGGFGNDSIQPRPQQRPPRRPR